MADEKQSKKKVRARAESKREPKPAAKATVAERSPASAEPKPRPRARRGGVSLPPDEPRRASTELDAPEPTTPAVPAALAAPAAPAVMAASSPNPAAPAAPFMRGIMPPARAAASLAAEAAESDAGSESEASFALPPPPAVPDFGNVRLPEPSLAPSMAFVPSAPPAPPLESHRPAAEGTASSLASQSPPAMVVESELPPIAVPGGRRVAAPRASILAPAPDDETGSVLITGICGRLGKLLVRELHRDTKVIGIDRRAFPDAPKDIVHHRFDLRRKKTRDVFRSGRVRAIVHLGVMHDPRSSHRVRHSWNVVAFQKLLEYMAQYRVRKLVVLSSANVYGPQPDNPQFLTEEAPLLGSQEFYAIRDLVELDMLAQGNFWKNPDVETVILRPCHILGEVRNAPSNYLRLENPISILGFDPMVQVIHERDVVRAVKLALEPGVRGVFNLRGPGELPLSRMFQLAGRRPVPVAAPLAKMALQQMFRFRLASFPAPEIDHIRYLCMVDDARAREVLGWAPKYSLEEAIEAALSAA